METFGNRLLIFCVFALLLCARASIGGPRHFVRRSLTKVVSVRGGAAGLSTYVTEEDEPSTSPKVVLFASTNARSTLGLHGRFSLMEDNIVGGHACYSGQDTIGKDNFASTRRLYLYWTAGSWRVGEVLGSDAYSTTVAYKIDPLADGLLDNKKQWHVKLGNSFQCMPELTITAVREETAVREVLGVPSKLLPYYLAFMLDAIAVGLVLPLLPYYAIELGADALQLSFVISANFLAQMGGCLIMGKFSDQFGRRLAMLTCLGASTTSFFCISHAKTLVLLALARVISGSFGGLVPIMQSAVSDATSPSDRPKYLGRVMATFGVGFVLGPALSALLPATFTAAHKFRLAACFPLLGLLVAALFAKETKTEVRPLLGRKEPVSGASKRTPFRKPMVGDEVKPPAGNTAVSLLVLNGFLNMFAFATESIYAVFLKDTFGYGESVLSGLFAVNGLITGLFQVFFIKPLIEAIGMPFTLLLGNVLLAVGMLGLGLVRHVKLHFFMFACHILGFSIADTALVSLISRFSPGDAQGRDLSLNQAAQSLARIASPLLAGWLYERSKRRLGLLGAVPVGALPFLVGGVCPLLAAVVPTVLSWRPVKSNHDDDGSMLHVGLCVC